MKPEGDFQCAIEFSAKDKIKEIRIPKHLDTDLAELVGIIIGDGHLRVRGYEHNIYVSDHCEDDAEYFHGRITSLFKRLFNIDHVRIRRRPGTNELRFVTYSKAATLFLKRRFDIPSNKSKIIRIPEEILRSNLNVKKAFIRGLADTDFSITFKRKYRDRHYYPVIHAGFASERLVRDISGVLNELGFRNYTSINKVIDKRNGKLQITFHIFISGKENFIRWFDTIKLQNSKHLIKYRIWKKFGYYPPRLTASERKAMLEKEEMGRGRFELPSS